MPQKAVINIPKNARKILNILEANGYEGYVVGGCVRDSLLFKEPQDWDITTDASPEEMIKCFSCFYNVIPTGIKHGTLTVIVEGEPFEVTTFRIDGMYTDSRRPEKVIFTKLLREDLARRDFTINAMAYNDRFGLIDCFNGINDLKLRIVKCVGNADERFKEDALRMLRAVRFSAQLNFEIEENTKNAIASNNKLLEKISVERINMEFSKIVLSGPDRLVYLCESGLMKHILPEFMQCIDTEQKNPYHIYNVGMHIIKSMENIDSKLHLRLAMLFHDIAKPIAMTIDENGIGHFYGHQERSAEMAKAIMERLRYDNALINKVITLILYHDIDIACTKKSVKKWLNKLGKDTLYDLIKVKKADMSAQNPKYYDKRFNELEQLKIIIDEVMRAEECFSLKDLKIDGDDLIDMGYKPGKQIGQILNELLNLVMEKPELNDKGKLIEIVKSKDCIYIP